MLLYLHPRWNHVLTSAVAWRGTDEHFWGRNLDCMGVGPTFPSRTIEAGSEPALPYAVEKSQGGEDTYISTDYQARSGFQVGDHVELLQLSSCACATRITWQWTLKLSVGRNLIYINAFICLTTEMSQSMEKISHINFLNYACPLYSIILLIYNIFDQEIFTRKLQLFQVVLRVTASRRILKYT